jgi:hypothetical protein
MAAQRQGLLDVLQEHSETFITLLDNQSLKWINKMWGCPNVVLQSLMAESCVFLTI